LKDVSFEVKQGQVLGILGHNGAGKSTLLKILSRITEPAEGYVDVVGRVGSLLEVGTGFHPELTGRENIYLNGAILGMRREEIQRKFDDIVAFSEVEKFIDTPVKHYSSGMYLRLAFAVAAHLEPEILLIDELLAVGDASFQRRCLGKLGQVAKEGRTVIFVSHNMPAITALADSCILLKHGQVHMEGEPDQVVSAYLKASAGQAKSLDKLKERSGSGELRVTAVEVCDAASGIEVNHILTGQDVLIRIHYRAAKAVNALTLFVDVTFRDSTGGPVCTLSTRFAQVIERVLPSEGLLECRVPALPLAEDNYTIDIWTMWNNVISDYVQNIPVPPVLSSDYYGTGQMPVRRKHGSLVVEHSWSAAV